MSAVPKDPPDLHIPESSSTVNVHIINSTTRIRSIPYTVFVEPAIPGFDTLDCPAFSFLIEHPISGRKLLFDLGLRKDWENLAPIIANRITDQGWDVSVQKNVVEILEEGGVRAGDIQTIIWRRAIFALSIHTAMRALVNMIWE